MSGIFHFSNLIEHSVRKQWRPFHCSDAGSRSDCFPMSHIKDARLIWVNSTKTISMKTRQIHQFFISASKGTGTGVNSPDTVVLIYRRRAIITHGENFLYLEKCKVHYIAFAL